MESWLTNGITATVSGMFTVFLVLIVIAFVISKFKLLNTKNKIAGENRVTSAADIVLPVKEEDDDEVVAAITAVLAMMQAESKDKLVVRRIKRID